jgi:hypothetical protein
MDAKELTADQIDEVIADLGCRNAAGGIYTGSVYEFARAIYALAELPHSDAAQAPIGWKLVPVDPTGEMLDAFRAASVSWSDGYPQGGEGYVAMLDAAPVAPGAAAQGEVVRVHTDRYQWLRRRVVMVDYSDETVIKLTLLKDEGPTGEFLDDWIDGEMAASSTDDLGVES